MIGIEFEGDLTPLVEDGEAIEQRIAGQASGILPFIGQLGAEDIREAFARQGSPSGSPWRALSHPYAEDKARRYGGKPILQRTGALLASIGYQVEGDEVLIGSVNGPLYAGMQGDREFADHSAEMEDEAEEATGLYFTEGRTS